MSPVLRFWCFLFCILGGRREEERVRRDGVESLLPASSSGSIRTFSPSLSPLLISIPFLGRAARPLQGSLYSYNCIDSRFGSALRPCPCLPFSSLRFCSSSILLTLRVHSLEMSLYAYCFGSLVHVDSIDGGPSVWKRGRKFDADGPQVVERLFRRLCSLGAGVEAAKEIIERSVKPICHFLFPCAMSPLWVSFCLRKNRVSSEY
jgi:hypothetical protein